MKFSIIIVNYNGETCIEKCIRSFEEQTVLPAEVLVIDSHSADQSVAIVKDRFPHLPLTEIKENIGYGAALNIGIKKAAGEIVVLANNDLHVCPEWVASVTAEFEKVPECGLVASKILYWDEPDRINSTGMLFYKDLSAVNRGLNEIDRGQYESSEEVFGANGAIMAFRKKVFDRIGFFDEDYFLFREEDELMWRMRRHGWIARYTPTAKAYHKRSANTTLFSPFKLYYSERNRFWNVLKHMPLRCNITLLPYVIMRYGANFMLAFKPSQGAKARKLTQSSKGKLIGVIVRAWLAALKGFPKMYRKRKEYEKGSKLSYQDCLRLMARYKADLSEMIK